MALRTSPPAAPRSPARGPAAPAAPAFAQTSCPEHGPLVPSRAGLPGTCPAGVARTSDALTGDSLRRAQTSSGVVSGFQEMPLR